MINYLQNRLDKLTRQLLRLLNQKAAVTMVIVINLLMYIPVIYRLWELDKLDNNPHTFLDPKGAKFFYHIASFILSSFFSMLFAHISKIYAEKFLPAGKKVEPGIYFASLATMSWAVSSCLIISFGYYMTQTAEAPLEQRWIGAITSDLNTLFFLCVIPYLEFENEPVLIRRCRRWFLNRKALFLLCVIWTVIYAVSYFLFEDGLIIIKGISLVITLLSFILFWKAFRTVFTERIKEQRIFFDFAAILLLFAILVDPTQKPLEDWDLAQKIILFGYRPLLLTVFVSLLLSAFYRIFKKKNEEIEKQNKELTVKEAELKKSNAELLDKTKKYEQEAQINKGLLPIALGDLKQSALNKILDFCLKALKENNVYDYAFGVGILDIERKSILFPYYFEDEKKIPNKRIATEKTFGGYCARYNQEVFLPSIMERELIKSYEVDPDNMGTKTAKDAHSLWYFPLRNPADGNCFGVLTIQSRVDYPSYTPEQKNIIAALVYILEQAIDPQRFWDDKPIIEFVRAARMDENGYHFDPTIHGKPLGDSPYEPLYNLMGTKTNTDIYFNLRLGEVPFLQGANFIQSGIDIRNYYWEYHPVNLTMKGVYEGTLSASVILLALTALVQQTQTQISVEFPEAKNCWDLLLELWLFERRNTLEISDLRTHNPGSIEYFCRGNQDQGECYEERLKVVSDLFEILILWDKKGEKYGRKNLIRVAIHLPELNEKIDDWPFNKSGILFEFGIREKEVLEAKIEEARSRLVNKGEKALSNNVSSKVVLLESVYFPGGAFLYEITNQSIMLKFFL